VEDSYGRHDTIYGCCSKPNNFLRCGIRGTHSCFGNFVEALAQFGLDRSYIVSNVNFFMSVPVAIDGAVVNIYGIRRRGTMSICAPSAMYWRCCQTVRRCTIPVTPTT